MAKSFENASTEIIRFFEGLDSQYKVLSEKEQDVEPSIEES